MNESELFNFILKNFNYLNNLRFKMSITSEFIKSELLNIHFVYCLYLQLTLKSNFTQINDIFNDCLHKFKSLSDHVQIWQK